jgi:hypothetical protein
VKLGPAQYWRLQIVGWTLFGGINAFVALGVAHLPALAAFAQAAGLGVCGFAFSHLLYLWIRRHELTRRPIQVRIVHVAAFSILLSIPAGFLTSLVGLAAWQTSDLRMEPGLRWLLVPVVHALNWILLLLFWGAYISPYARSGSGPWGSCARRSWLGRCTWPSCVC